MFIIAGNNTSELRSSGISYNFDDFKWVYWRLAEYLRMSAH